MSQPQTEPRGLWRPAIVALVLMALCFVRAATWQWLNLHSPNLRLTPRGEHLLAAAALALPLFPAGALLWSAITQRLKTQLTVVLVLLVGLGAAGALSLFAWVPWSDGTYELSALSPEGTREAHLHLDAQVGCIASVYLAEPQGVWGERAQQREVDCDSLGLRCVACDGPGARCGPCDGLRVLWLPDGGTEVTGRGARPLDRDFGPR